jgi:hypothetical protein
MTDTAIYHLTKPMNHISMLHWTSFYKSASGVMDYAEYAPLSGLKASDFQGGPGRYKQ